MAIGRRAAMFTMIVLVFLLVIFMSLKTENLNRQKERSFVIGERIKAVNYFIDDLEIDIQRGVYIAGFRSLLGIQQYITQQGEYINETNTTFLELLLNGSIGGNYQSVMNNTELPVWFEKIKTEAEKTDILLEYEIVAADVYQSTPWVITIDLYVRMNISDSRGTARWELDKVIPTKLEIFGFEDPLYTVGTYGRVINVIEITNISNFTNGTDTSNLLHHLDNSLYIASNTSPSYLMRLSNNLSASPYGIESLVNLKKLEEANLDILNKTCVDYLYFSASNPQNWLINYTYNWFRLDNESDHLAFYQVQNLTIT